MLTPVSVEIRPARRSDAGAARTLVLLTVEATPYADWVAEVVGQAFEGSSDHVRALVAERAGDVVGLIVYGEVAAAVGAGQLHLIVVTAGARLQGVATQLVDAAITDLARRHARFVLAEVPDDPRLAPGRELLLRSGFAEEARVPDFYADGVALTFLRRPVAS